MQSTIYENLTVWQAYCHIRSEQQLLRYIVLFSASFVQMQFPAFDLRIIFLYSCWSYCAPFTKVEALSETVVGLFFRLYVQRSKTVRFRAMLTMECQQETPVLEVEFIGHHGRMATRRGQNVIEAEKHTSSMSRKPSKIKPRLLLNVNRESQAAYHLLWSSVSL